MGEKILPSLFGMTHTENRRGVILKRKEDSADVATCARAGALCLQSWRAMLSTSLIERSIDEVIQMMEGWMGNWGTGSMGWWGGPWMILVWILAIAGVVAIVRLITSRSGTDKNNRD